MKKTIVLMLAIALLIIGIHQSMRNGIANSYWVFMFSVGFLFYYQYLNKYVPEKEKPEKKAKPVSRRKTDGAEEKKSRILKKRIK